ncbi:hypothetical protein [Priestia aryabhattai]
MLTKPAVMKAINEGEFNWTVSELKDILASANGWWGAEGSKTTWEDLAENLNKGRINIKVEACPIYEMPDSEDNYEEWLKFDDYATNKKGNSTLVHMRWCSFKWAIEKYGEEPKILKSGANGYIENEKLAIKAGESGALNVIDWLISGSKFAIIPYPVNSKLYVYTFSAKKEFIKESEDRIAATINQFHEHMKRAEKEYLEKRSKGRLD